MSDERKPIESMKDMLEAMDAGADQETLRQIAEKAFSVADGLLVILSVVKSMGDEETDAIINSYYDRLQRRFK